MTGNHLPGNFIRLWAAKRLPLLLVFTCVFFLLLTYQFGNLIPTHTASRYESTSPAANGTLGFGAIYVLSEDDTTWRVQGLRKAAAFAELQVTFALRKHLSDEEIYAHLAGHEPMTVLDEIRAALNYLSLLETFISTGYETAMFFEDDVDFDINVKAQMEAISQAILPHVESDEDSPSATTDGGSQIVRPEFPYGKDQWDVFWIGHYGIEDTHATTVVDYFDQYALPWDHLTSKFNNYYEQMGAGQIGKEPQQRMLLSAAPMGTYAFALTRASAQRLVRKIRDEHVQQFDLAIHIDCKGLKHRCMAPVPALMHHHRVKGQKSIQLSGNQNDGRHDLSWWRDRHKYTYNVQWSARCNAAGVGEKLGIRWQCMPGRYDDIE